MEGTPGPGILALWRTEDFAGAADRARDAAPLARGGERGSPARRRRAACDAFSERRRGYGNPERDCLGSGGFLRGSDALFG